MSHASIAASDRSGEALYRGSFIVEHFDHGDEARDLEHVADALLRPQQLQLATLVGHQDVAPAELPDSRAVDEIDVCQVQDDFGLTLLRPFAQHSAQRLRGLT